MIVTVEKINRFTLVHPEEDITYVFVPHEYNDDVWVTHHNKGTVGNYVMSVEEARDLWRSLREKSYIRF